MADKKYSVKLVDIKKNKSQVVNLIATNPRQAGILAKKVSEFKTVSRVYLIG